MPNRDLNKDIYKMAFGSTKKKLFPPTPFTPKLNDTNLAERSQAFKKRLQDIQQSARKLAHAASITKTRQKTSGVAVKSFRSNMPYVSGGKIRGRRFKPRKRQKMQMRGITMTRECGKQLTQTAQIVWVGHNTGAYLDMQLMLWRVALKKLMNKTGFSIRDFGSIATNITAGDVFQVEVQTGDGTTTIVTHTYVANQTWDTIVGTFQGSVPNSPNSICRAFAYIPTVNTVGTGSDRAPARMDLEHAKVKVYLKSSMKLQNRTVNGTDTSMEDVDNVPLYGKLYGGWGNGAIQQSREGVAVAKQLIAGRANGYIEGVSTDTGMGEPISQVFFPGVNESGKVRIEPGKIKTSVLVYRKSYMFNSLKNVIATQASVDKIKGSFGKYRFFGLERIIQTGASDAITLGIEINHFICFDMYVRFPNVTLPSFVTDYTI